MLRRRVFSACAWLVVGLAVIVLVVSINAMRREWSAIAQVADVWSAGQAWPFYGFPIAALLLGIYLLLTRRTATPAAIGVGILVTALMLIIMGVQLADLLEYGAKVSGPAL